MIGPTRSIFRLAAPFRQNRIVSVMDSVISLSLLAAAPGTGPYADLIKVAVVVALLFVWAMGVQWVDRDTNVVKTKREEWNLIVVSGGVVATFVLLFVPYWQGGLFLVGLVFWLLLAGGSMFGYVMHRNGRVVPTARILTIGHIRRLVGSGQAKKKATRGKALRVQITDHAGQFVEMPDDYEEAKAYELVQDFLYDLLWRRAADADVLAGKEKYRLVYRIDGVAAERQEGIPPRTASSSSDTSRSLRVSTWRRFAVPRRGEFKSPC